MKPPCREQEGFSLPTFLRVCNFQTLWNCLKFNEDTILSQYSEEELP